MDQSKLSARRRKRSSSPVQEPQFRLMVTLGRVPRFFPPTQNGASLVKAYEAPSLFEDARMTAKSRMPNTTSTPGD